MTLTDEQRKLIETNKNFIDNLHEVIELYFSTLVEELEATEAQRDWLFDYIYNSNEPTTFEEYTKEYNVNLEEL